jgi:hypothetical protein
VYSSEAVLIGKLARFVRKCEIVLEYDPVKIGICRMLHLFL